jgi:hypothetical protein
MKTILKFLVIIVLFISCDTNDNNDPTVDCDADFYTMSSPSADSFLGRLNICKYQKSDNLSLPTSASTNNNFVIGSGILLLPSSTVNTSLGKIIYQFSEANGYYSFDINTNTVTNIATSYGSHAEFLGNDLRFLKVIWPNLVSGYVQSGDVYIGDDAGNDISNFQNFDFSNSGLTNVARISSTSDGQDKLYYMANTKLFVYDEALNTWSDYLLETFDETTNKIIFKGVEYAGNNVLYALRADVTDVNNVTLELIKIDVNGSTPQITVLKDLTNALSVQVSDYLINNSDYISSSYDSCDDSYYFSLVDIISLISANSILFEVKLVSDTIYEYPVNGEFLYGINKY